MPGKATSPAVRRECAHRRRHTHGTTAAYKADRCRCTDCRAACAHAWRERNRAIVYGRYPVMRIDSLGAARRLQSLSRLGWSARTLAGRCDMQVAHLQAIRSHRVRYLTPATDETIRAVYRELWDQRPLAVTKYERGAVSRAIRHAELAGWLLPIEWDDDDLIRKQQAPRPPQQLKPCGTYAAYKRHVRAGEKPDQACRNAHAAETAQRRRAAA